MGSESHSEELKLEPELAGSVKNIALEQHMPQHNYLAPPMARNRQTLVDQDNLCIVAADR